MTTADTTTTQKPETAVTNSMAMVPTFDVNLTPSSAQNRPQWLDHDGDMLVKNGVEQFMLAIRQNPTDITISTKVYGLGQDGAKELLPNTKLFERKIATIMTENQEGSPTNRTLLQLKQELDQVNPVVLSQQPISVKVAILFSKTRLPKSQEILDMIYARRETVKSTVDGLKVALWETRDRLTTNIADIDAIYKGLEKGQRLIQRDIYFGELLAVELKKEVDMTTDEIAKQNLEQVLADLTTAIINLKTEENANMQFFAGAQNLAKLTNMQASNITSVTNILERSVLANLALRVVATELAASVAATEQLKKTIGDTIADTAKVINQSTDTLIAARSSAAINLEALEEGCKQLEEVFAKQANANREIIEKGTQTSRKLSELTARLSARIDGSMNKPNVSGAQPLLTSA